MIKSITDLRVNICPTICQTRLRLVGNFLDFAKRARLCVKSALNAWWNFIVSTSNQSHAKHDKRSVFPSYKTCDGVLGYLLREGDSGSVGVGAEDRGAGWVLSDESLGTFPNRGRSGGGGAPSLLLVCKPDQVWQPRSNNHTPLRSRTKHIFIFISWRVRRTSGSTFRTTRLATGFILPEYLTMLQPSSWQYIHWQP